MSSSGQGESADTGAKSKGLTKVMRRASLILGRDKSKRALVSDPAGLATGEESGNPAMSASLSYSSLPTSRPTTARADTTPTLSVPAGISQAIRGSRPNPTSRLGMTARETGDIQEQKARALFAKYGLTLEPAEWRTPITGDTPRVEKQVRMRARRTCHRCQTTFGADRICSNCQHTRCKKCPRFPEKKHRDPKDKELSAKDMAAELDTKPQTNEALTMPDRVTGKELTRRIPMQRVRRNCHQCQTLFSGRATQCVNCKHIRCPACPREPPKLEKYADGYPGDSEQTFSLSKREMRPIRTRVRWSCDRCNTTFKDHEKICNDCGHDRCEQCPRYPPKKMKLPFDEAALRSAEEKLRTMSLSPQLQATAA